MIGGRQQQLNLERIQRAQGMGVVFTLYQSAGELSRGSNVPACVL